MYKRVLKLVVLTSFAVLTALPASPQIVAELGGLHIRIANSAPPPVRYEHRTTRPYADAVWINGYWDRQDDNWAWLPGRWERPRDNKSHWINAKYGREGTAWRYEPAHWSHQQLVEGDDYRRWKEEHHSDHDHDHQHN